MTQKSLRFVKDEPPLFSQDDAFIFHLLDYSAEVLLCEGKQLGHFPKFQGDQYLNCLLGIAFIFIFDLDYLTEKFLQPLSSGKGTPFANGDHAGIYLSSVDRRYPAGE